MLDFIFMQYNASWTRESTNITIQWQAVKKNIALVSSSSLTEFNGWARDWEIKTPDFDLEASKLWYILLWDFRFGMEFTRELTMLGRRMISIKIKTFNSADSESELTNRNYVFARSPYLAIEKSDPEHLMCSTLLRKTIHFFSKNIKYFSSVSRKMIWIVQK